MREKVIFLIKKLYKVGFVHIFGTSVLNKLLALITNMVLIRILDKADFGYYSYAFNIVAIVMIFSDIGTRIARFQFCCETNDPSQRDAITRFTNRIGVATNIFFAIGTFIYATYLPMSIPGAKCILQMLSGFMLFQFLYEQQCYAFRIEKENKKYAYLSNFNSLLYLVLVCAASLLWGAKGTVIGRYFAFIIPTMIAWMIYKKQRMACNYPKIELSSEMKKTIIKYGLLIMATNCVSSVLHYFDTFLVGLIVTDELILADYKVATTIPTALDFIPISLITFIYPYFVEHKDDSAWIRKKMRLVQWCLSVPCCVISLGGVVFSKQIVTFIFGSQYASAVPVFKVLMITFFISAIFRVMYGNVLAMMHLVKVNFVLGTIECVLNIIADVLLIKQYGSIGAAYATMIITVFSSVASGIYFYYYLKKNKEKSY